MSNTVSEPTTTAAVENGHQDSASGSGEPSQSGSSVGPRLADEVARRRTFAIISHPDAGKTTLTEKLLLYGGAVHLAGSVRARKNQRTATSDWMQMEQDRGISVTSTVLQFGYEGYCVNLLDTPGHQDFSEDTYRTLMAVDSAVMVLDAAKGIETQTTKLFRVCRQRGIPILTFINKLDRFGKDRLELMDEIESVLQMDVVPMNWPVGSGDRFAGIYDRSTGDVHLFQRAESGHEAKIEGTCAPDAPRIRERLGQTAYAIYQEELELLDAVGVPFDHDAFLAGTQTPVFFGSALNNFGVQMFLDRFLKLAPPPGPRPSDSGPVSPVRDEFSGFVFKIQSNMDPQHRDSVAFVRVCSGHFERDMQVEHPRTGRTIRLSRPHRSFANEREILDEAFPGDVVGLVNPGAFVIGDTICTGDTVRFEPMPRFAPEHFAVLQNVETRRYKQFQKGLAQLEAEGAMQVYTAPDAHRVEPILGVVGQLQFDVVQFRLESEYGVKTRLDVLPYTTAMLVEAEPATLKRLPWSMAKRVVDTDGQTVALFTHEWTAKNWEDRYPVKLHEIGAGIGVFASET